MFDPANEDLNEELLALLAAYTSAERRANVATQLRDRFGRWVEMGRDFSFKFKSGGRVKSTTGTFVGAVPNRPGYGLILLRGDADFGDAVVEVNMKAGQQVLAKLSADALRKAGVTKAGHDVNGNPIGDVIDADIEDIADLKKNDITRVDVELARGELSESQREAIERARAEAPDYESTNVVAEIDATKEDLGEGYAELQRALGREVPEAEAGPSTSDVDPRTLKPGDKVLVDGEVKTVKRNFSTDSGQRVTFTDNKVKSYNDGALAQKVAEPEAVAEIPTPEAEAPQADSVELARQLNEIAGRRSELEMVANQMRRFGGSPERLQDAEDRLAKLDEEYEAKRKEYEASLPDTSEQDAIDERERLKSELQWYDNEQGDVARQIDEGASGPEILDWLRANSAGWVDAENDLRTSWAVELPSRVQRDAWAKFEKLRSDLEGYNISTGGGDGVSAEAKDRDGVYRELANALGIEESELRRARTGAGSDQARRTADAIEYFGDLIDKADVDKADLYGRLSRALKQDVENAKTNTPAAVPEVAGEPQDLIERVAKEEGGTVEATTGTPLTTGIAVGLRNRNEEIVDTAFFDRELGRLALNDYINKNFPEFAMGNKLGLWHDKDNREVTLDISKIFDENSEEELERAKAWGRENNQQGIFGIEFRGYIDTGGTGDRGRARRQREESRLSGDEGSDGPRPEGLGEPVGGRETETVDADLRQPDGQRPEEAVELTDDFAEEATQAVVEVRDVVSEIDSTEADISEDQTAIANDVAEVESAVEQKNGNAVMRGVRALVEKIGALRDKLALSEDSQEETNLESVSSKLIDIRNSRKNKQDGLDETPTSLSEAEIAPTIEIPENIEESIFDELRTPDNIDYSRLNESQAKLLQALIGGKNRAILGMSNAKEQNDTNAFNRQYLLARIYSGRVNDLVSDIALRGEKADIFGGIDNRVRNLKIIENSIVRGPGNSQDKNVEVIKFFKAIFVGKSGTAYELEWNYDSKMLGVYRLNPNGTRGQSVGYQGFSDRGGGKWHFDTTSSRISPSVFYETRYGRSKKYVTTAYVTVSDNKARGDGLGGIMALASQYAIEGAGRKFMHSLHLLPDGNRNSKIVNGHDPALHHPSQLEKLLEVKKSKIAGWLKELGWVNTQDSPNEPEKRLLRTLYQRDTRGFENFYAPLGAYDSFAQEGPIWHLNGLLRQHANAYREGFKSNPNAREQVAVPSVYEKFVKGRTSNGTNPEFDVLEIVKELAYEDGISKEEAVKRLAAIRDSLQEASNQPFPNVIGFSNAMMDRSFEHLTTNLTRLIEKIETSDFTDADKLSRKEIRPLEDVTPVQLNALGLEQGAGSFDEISKDIEKLYESVEMEIPPAPREIGGDFSSINVTATAGGQDRIQEEDINPRDLTARIAPLVNVRPRVIRSASSQRVLTVLNEKHTPTVTEEQWRAGQASDDPRIIARNFSTSVLRKAYIRSVFPATPEEKVTLTYQDGKSIQVGHAALRDALQMQGENTDALVNSQVPAYNGRMLLQDLPSSATLKSEASFGAGTRRDYSFENTSTPDLAVVTYEDKDSNGTIALIANVSSNDPNAGSVIGRVLQNPNGTYAVALAREDGPAVDWPAEADGLSRLENVAFVQDRNVALLYLENEAQRRASTNSELIQEIDRSTVVSGTPVIEVNNTALNSSTREIRFGLNGQRYLIRRIDQPGRDDIFSIFNADDISGVARIDRQTAPNGSQFFQISYGSALDNNTLPEGANNFGTRFKTEEDATRALGELFGLANGASVNPLTNEPIRTLEELPQATAVNNPDGTRRYTSGNSEVVGGDIVTPRGGITTYTSQNLLDGEARFEANALISNFNVTTGPEVQINYGSEEGKYVVSYKESIRTPRESKEFDSYQEALAFARDWAQSATRIDNPEQVLRTKIDEPTAEPEATEVPEVDNRLAEIVSGANSDPVDIDDSYTPVDESSVGVSESSNPVRVYRDSEGKLWVVKRAAHTLFGDDFSRQVDMEIFASALYRAMGIEASDIRRARVDGDDNYLISPLIPRSQENLQNYISEAMESGDQEKIDGFRKGLALDLLMNNLDVYFHPDNMVIGEDGKVYRIDNGSAMFYLPSRDRQPYRVGFNESSSIEEILNLTERIISGRDSAIALPYPNRDSVVGVNDVFNKDSEDMKRYVSEVVAPLTDETLEQLVSVIRDDVDRQRTLDTLKYRRDGMLEYYGVPKLGETRPFVSQVRRERLDEAEALGMPEGFMVIRRPEEDTIQIEHSEEEDGIPHSMVTITVDSENNKYELVGFDRSLDPTVTESYENEEDALRRASEFLNQEEGATPAPTSATPEPTEVPENVAEVAPRIVDSPRLVTNLSQPQIVLNAVKQAFEGHQVLPNGDILVASRTFQGRTRGDNRVFKYEVVLHKTANDDFVAYVRQYQVDNEGNRVGEVSVARFTDKSHSPEVTVSRVRALLNGNTSGRGINGTNPNNWFNNSSDKEKESVDPATNQPIPSRFVDGRQDIEYIGDTGIPKTGNGAVDALILQISNQLSSLPEGPERQQFIDSVIRNSRNNPVLRGSQLEDVVERIVANREAPGANMVPYPSRDGNTIVRVGDKVRHTYNGVTKIGYVTKRTRISYQRESGVYSYEDVVYVNFPGARGGSRRITTKNLEVLQRADGSAPLPVDALGNAVQKKTSSRRPQQLKWQEGSDGVAYLGAQGKTSEELRSSSTGFIESVTMPDGAVLYKLTFRDANGIQRTAYYDSNVNTIDEVKQMLLDRVK